MSTGIEGEDIPDEGLWLAYKTDEGQVKSTTVKCQLP